jgi:pimeloyl-ACP methyl ester carboxylesterase
MANYVLVHGGNISTETWNRLTRGSPVQTPNGTMGGEIWDGTVSALTAHHHRVYAPALHDEHFSTLTDHILQVSTVITEQDLWNVILVGHSYGGMIITGVAGRMPERIRHLVYIDAALPDPGQSLFDIIGSGGREPLSFAGLEPASPYVERLQFDPVKIRLLPKTYILCTRSEFTSVTWVAQQKIAADTRGWTYRELPTSHVPMASMPDELSQLLLAAAEQ